MGQGTNRSTVESLCIDACPLRDYSPFGGKSSLCPHRSFSHVRSVSAFAWKRRLVLVTSFSGGTFPRGCLRSLLSSTHPRRRCRALGPSKNKVSVRERVVQNEEKVPLSGTFSHLYSPTRDHSSCVPSSPVTSSQPPPVLPPTSPVTWC